MIQIWQVPSECGPSNLVVLGLIKERIDLNKNNLYNLFKSSIINGIRMVLLIVKKPNIENPETCGQINAPW